MNNCRNIFLLLITPILLGNNFIQTGNNHLVNYNSLSPIEIEGEIQLGDFEILPIVCVMTLYAFLGIECASIPAENIKNPEKNIPKATMIGTIVSTIIYIFGTVVLFGVLPTDIIINSPAPFAEAGEIIGGKYAGYFVSAGAAISAIGALNGWVFGVFVCRG